MSQDAIIAKESEGARAELAPVEGGRVGEALLPAWRDLCSDLVEENPFYEPWSLIPALAAYGRGRERLACVWAGDELIGLAPVTPARGYARMPVGHWKSWMHPHCFFTAPLVRKGREGTFFKALFSLLGEGDAARGFLRLARMDREGPLMRAAEAAAVGDRRVAYAADVAERALLCGGASADATLAVFVRKKKRKELKRLRNRLDEKGRVEVREHSETDDLNAWTDAFLALEHSGWKAKKGTSLKASAADTQWFRQTLTGARDAGKLHFIRIDLDGRPIAMLVNLLSRGEGYSLKICHDPDFARYSPGVMVEIEAMRSLLGRPDFRFMDSCAAPDHSMINGLWRAKRKVTGLNVSGKGTAARATLRLCRALEGARAKLPVGRARP